MKSRFENGSSNAPKERGVFRRVFGAASSAFSKAVRLMKKSAVISTVCAILAVTCTAAVIILFASHVFGGISANISDVSLKTNIEFNLVSSSESFVFKKGGEKKPSIKSAQQAKERAKQYFMRDELEEEAVKCAHLRGKEKYIQQLDNFLASGLIDKAEYRVLKARYDKLNITDNMH